MDQKKHNRSWSDRLVAWVNGDREDRDRTLFIMEQRPPRYVPPTEEEHEARERQRLHRFFDWYPAAALLLCGILTSLLLCAVFLMPGKGVVQAGEGVAVGSWALELLGESCLMFLSMSGVRVLLRGREADKRELKGWREVSRRELLLGTLISGALLLILVTALDGIAGGALTGALMAVPALFRGRELLRCRGYAQAASLLLCVVLSGVSIYAGDIGDAAMVTVAAELLEISAGASSAFAVYGVCSLAAENRAEL